MYIFSTKKILVVLAFGWYLSSIQLVESKRGVFGVNVHFFFTLQNRKASVKSGVIIVAFASFFKSAFCPDLGADFQGSGSTDFWEPTTDWEPKKFSHASSVLVPSRKLGQFCIQKCSQRCETVRCAQFAQKLALRASLSSFSPFHSSTIVVPFANSYTQFLRCSYLFRYGDTANERKVQFGGLVTWYIGLR